MNVTVKKMANGRYKVQAVDLDPYNDIKTIYATQEQLQPFFLYGSMLTAHPCFNELEFNYFFIQFRARKINQPDLSGIRVIRRKKTDAEWRELFDAERQKRIEDRRKSKELRECSIFIRLGRQP